MEIDILKGDLMEQKCDILVVSVLEDGGRDHGGADLVDQALGGSLKKILKEEDFTGKKGTSLLIRPDIPVAAKRILIVGLGKKKKLHAEIIRQAAATAVNIAKQRKAKTVCSVLLGLDGEGLSSRIRGQAMAEGALLANYTFAKYKKEKHPPLKKFTIVSSQTREVHAAQKGIELGKAYAEGTIFARKLVDTPGEHMKPKDLVDAARGIAKGNGQIRIKVIDEAGLKKMGAGGILAVNQGSDHEPYMVHIVFKPKGKSKKKVALVGKAVTFDSGGLSLKPSNAMETMKIDMAGAAAVLGAFHAMTKIAPKVEVHGIFGAVENMPSGKAIRPGDVVKTMSGKTIEILNTDAEGRVTLADTLYYGSKLKPDMMIDLATLTGACVVALGEEITGLMANDQKLAEKLLASSQAVGEKMWQLPLEENYKSQIKSQIADVKNIGGKWGGTLTAGLFLQEFVKEDIPWAHMDIAGPSYAERPMNPYMKFGATGYGVRTLLEFLRNI